MNKEEIDKWLDNEYGISYTRLEELHDFYFEKYCDLEQENKQLKEKCEYLKQVKENKNKWFQLIADIGYDYDGCSKVENLKGLIDELVQYALNGRDNYDYEEFILKGEDNE